MTERSAWFRIGETLVAESKSEITPEQAIEKIRKYIQQMDMWEYTDLPSAQPEIIRCRDCKHYYFADNRIPQEQRYVCGLDGDRWKPDDYCSFAERMKGEQE